MKRFITTAALLLCINFMIAVSWFCAIKPEIEGNNNFINSNRGATYITVPVGGREYVDVPIDAINTELQETNQLTLWQFNDVRVMRTSNPVTGDVYSGDVYYSSNQQVFKRFGDYYITVTSPTKTVGVSADRLQDVSSYTAPCPEMTELNQIEFLPATALPVDYTEENTWKLPADVEELVLTKSSDDMSFYKDNWYFNYNFRYMKFNDAVVDAAARVCALSHQTLDWWYQGSNVFIAKSGDEYACVKQRDYTSCYFISSNDLSYIMLNLE